MRPDEEARIRWHIESLTASIYTCKDNLLAPGETWIGGDNARIDAGMLSDWQDELAILWASLAEIEQAKQSETPDYALSDLLDYNPWHSSG